ncbi:MAG: smalltalk protein [Hoylesella buccalis]
MAVMYKLYQDKRVTSSTKGKWYARAIHPQVIETDALAERIQRNCTVKRSDVVAVLAELVEVMQDELQQSRVVKLNGFGSFKIGLRTKPADKAADFNVTSNVVNYRVNFLPEMTGGGGKGKKRNRKFLDGLKVQEAPKNPVDTKKPAEGKAEENVASQSETLNLPSSPPQWWGGVFRKKIITMKRINWKLIFKIIITIATAILGMLNSQDKLPYNEN